ncbi:MAG: hypothetical protein AAF288_12575 [Planctomycetota bacterium]
MEGWVYIDGSVAAPLHEFERDLDTGLVRFVVSTRLVRNRSALRGRVELEHHQSPQRFRVRCLGCQREPRTLKVEAVDLGISTVTGAKHLDEDYLAIDGRTACQLDEAWVGRGPNGAARHAALRFDSADWRRLRCERGAPLSGLPEPEHSILDLVEGRQEITPALLLLPRLEDAPRLEVIRLARRRRLAVQMLAADWSSSGAWVLAHVTATRSIRKAAAPLLTAESGEAAQAAVATG